MIFMSQSAITTPDRENDWDRWYVDHLGIMVTVPGVYSAQRFKTTAPDYPRSLAMYSMASADVFNDPYYQSIRGLGEWAELVDRRFYRRNLFDGADRAPAVNVAQVLLVADRDAPELELAGVEWKWLTCVGIDRTTPYRGIAVVQKAAGETAAATKGVALYRPVTMPVGPN
jgi:hypothetical protein